MISGPSSVPSPPSNVGWTPRTTQYIKPNDNGILLLAQGHLRLQNSRRLSKLRQERRRDETPMRLDFFLGDRLIVIYHRQHSWPLFQMENGNHFVIISTDCYSKLTLAVSTAKTSTSFVLTISFENWILPYGIPLVVLTDGSLQFVVKLFEILCFELKVKHLYDWASSADKWLSLELWREYCRTTVSLYLRTSKELWEVCPTTELCVQCAGKQVNQAHFFPPCPQKVATIAIDHAD